MMRENAAEREKLKEVSATLGADIRLVQAAGGNTSVKQDGILWIKASGTWLKHALERGIFLPVRLDRLREALSRDDPACETCAAFVASELNPSGLRPSIETAVHALMPRRVVIHVHCVETIAEAVRRDAAARLARRLDGFSWALVPYVRPGLPLAHAIAAAMGAGTDVLVLANHGIVAAADTVDEAHALLIRAVAALKAAPRPAPRPDLDGLKAAAAGSRYRLPVDEAIHATACDPVCLGHARKGTLYPDHAIFLGAGIRVFAGEFPHDGKPPLVFVPGKGALVHEAAVPAVEPMARCLAEVTARLEANADVVALTAADEHALLNWEAEAYRQKLGAR